MNVLDRIKNGELTLVLYQGLMQVRNIEAENELLQLLESIISKEKYVSVWEIHQTTDGYRYDDKPCLASFDDYEKAVKFLYDGNKNNEKKLGIINVIRLNKEDKPS